MMFRWVILSVLFSLGLSLASQVPVTVRYDEESGLSSRLVGGGVQDREGLLWFATWNGLNCYDGYEFHRVRIRPGDSASIGTNLIRDIILMDDGNILCHTDNDIYIFDLSTYTFRDVDPVQTDSLMRLVGRNWKGLTDSQGSRWTADNSGLYKSFTAEHPAVFIPGSNDLNPRSFMVDCRDSVLWIGSRSRRALYRFKDSSWLETIPVPTVPYCIYQTSDGNVWVGGKPGALVRLDGDKPGESITDLAVYDMMEDGEGRLWVATFGGGLRCCPDPGAVRPVLSECLGGRKVRKLLITESGNLIAATTDGLLVADIKERDFDKIGFRLISRDGYDSGSLSSNAVMSVARDSSGNIFVATESSGVDVIGESILMSDKPVFRHLNIPSAEINRALAVRDDSTVVIVGSDQVTIYNPLSDSNICLSRAFWGDTCHFNETTPVSLCDGLLALGAEEGVFFIPSEIPDNLEYIPPVVFTTLSVNGSPAEFGLVSRRVIELSPGERNISVGYTALDYIDNTGILYRTRLDGSAWSGASSNRWVTLFNLSPGTHTLEVQSTDRFGQWADNVRSISIHVSPYWFETLWARTMAVILILGCIAGIILTWLYIRRIERQRRELLDKYMEALQPRVEADVSPSVMPELTPDQRPEDNAFLNRVRLYIEDNMADSEACVDAMAAAAAVSRSTLNRRLHSLLGVSASQLLMEARMQRAARLVSEHTVNTISEVADMCGYSDVHYFQRVFKKRFGVLPADFTP